MYNKIISIVWSLPFLWFALSYFDTMAHQSGGAMAAWNLFNMIVNR